MRKKIRFVAALILAAVCMFVVGGIEFYQLQEYKNKRIEVTAKLVGSKTKPEHVTPNESGKNYQHSVRYSAMGQELFAMPYFSKADSKTLLSKGKIEIFVLSNDPKRIFFGDEKLANGSTWFVLGCCLFFLSLLAWILLRKELAKND